MARLQLDRRLPGGGVIRVMVESADIVGHSAITDVLADTGINHALVNVLDVTAEAVAKRRATTERNSDR